MMLSFRSAFTLTVCIALPYAPMAHSTNHNHSSPDHSSPDHSNHDSAAHHHASTMTVTNAKVRQPIPGRTMSAAFMQISNQSQQDIELVSARADWSERIEIHTHLHENGVMKMREIESLPIAAGSSVTLQPGGLHLMLFGLSPNLSTRLPLELCFSDQHCITIEAELYDPR
ncbi:MAG: copper chaperone PCu(A)C [Bacterioplanes sp.]|nr:copper chaperone PCu(A)C [Bacterioplanes sp.]